MSAINLLTVKGSAYDRGVQHGRTYRDAIRHFTAERVRLCSDWRWTGRSLSRARVLALAEACLAEHEAYSPWLMDEMRGLAAATGLSLPELIINNGFTDFVDTIYRVGADDPADGPTPATPGGHDCTAFIVPDRAAAGGQGFCGQTWDMHASATPYVMLLRVIPETGPAALLFTVAGCLGMIGLNEAGIAVGINNLEGSDGQVGVTWPFVIRQILAQENLASAFQCLRSARLAGAHNYLLFDRHGHGYNVEAMSTRTHVSTVTPASDRPLAHTNHCLAPETQAVERDRDELPRYTTIPRLARAEVLLDRERLSLDDVMALTRDTEAICRLPDPIWQVETCGAAIMRPASGEMWAVQGRPAEHAYERFVVRGEERD